MSNAAEDVRPVTYEETFDRNLGWLKPEEQAGLRASRVAIAGLGGAGGYQAEALARLGVGHFKIADHDVYEHSNMNRQIGATHDTIGQSKARVMCERILSINPAATVETFFDPVSEANVDAFIEDCDLVIDGVEFFELDAKLLLFKRAREAKIPVITSCPLGFGASAIIFTPDSMPYEEYFDLHPALNDKQKKSRISFGLSPSPFCFKYMDRQALNLDQRRAASVAPGLMLVGALTASEAVKLLTKKEKVRLAPWIYQVDLLTYRAQHKYYRWGMKSVWMRAKRWLILEFGLKVLKKLKAS